MGFIKIKEFCTRNYTIKNVKRRPTEWEKMFANPDKELLFLVCKKSENSIIKKTTQ